MTTIISKYPCVCGLHSGAPIVICAVCDGVKPASLGNPFSTGMPVEAYKATFRSTVHLLKSLPWWKRLLNRYELKITDHEKGGFSIIIE